jgi:UDPglucose--hexose-1-phosphate uridylyltransferase
VSLHSGGPHRRHNPLLDEWVLVSPHRLERPWQGQVEDAGDEELPAYDPACYLCPGNARANGQRNPPYDTTFAFDNDFPALLPRTEDASTSSASLMRAEPVGGICRVICFTPRHDLSLARMPAAGIRTVVEGWIDEVRALAARPGIGYVQLFENKGELMGCSNPHPHCQVWATEHVPTIPARKRAAQAAYFARHGRDLLGDYLEQEAKDGARTVAENDHWVCLVPFWAVWPFETLLVPRRAVADLPSLAGAERDALAALLKNVTVRYDNLFRTSFPYSMAWQGRPVEGEAPGWRLHALFLPPLLRSATVRKFLVGYELAAEPQRDLTPEDAAARLRAQDATHHRDGAVP